MTRAPARAASPGPNLLDGCAMEERTVSIPAMHCGHCAATISRELLEIEGVESVKGDAEKKQVRIRWKPPATWDRIAEALAEIGFPPSVR